MSNLAHVVNVLKMDQVFQKRFGENPHAALMNRGFILSLEEENFLKLAFRRIIEAQNKKDVKK
jgi:hypothetical protein